MLTDEFKQLIDRSVQANVQLLTRAGGVLREAARASKEPQRLRGRDARALLGDLVKLQLDYLKTLSDSSVQYLGSVVGLAETAVAPAAPVPETAAQASDLHADSSHLTVRVTMAGRRAGDRCAADPATGHSVVFFGASAASAAGGGGFISWVGRHYWAAPREGTDQV